MVGTLKTDGAETKIDEFFLLSLIVKFWSEEGPKVFKSVLEVSRGPKKGNMTCF